MRIELFLSDTKEIALQRIAAALNTLPKYIFVKTPFPDSGEYDTDNVVDVLSLIRKETQFAKLYDKIKDYIQPLNLKIEKDIATPWIVLTGEDMLAGVDDAYVGAILNGLEYEISSKSGVKVDLESIWNRKDEIERELMKEIKANKEYSEKVLKQAKEFAETQSLIYTEFEKEKITYTFNLRLQNSLLELFNLILLTPNVPMASIQPYYKVLNDFTPYELWSAALPNAILFRVAGKKVVKGEEDYITVALTSESKLSFQIHLKENISKESVVERIEEVLRFKLDITDETEESVNGVFYIPNQKLNKYLFADLALNDPFFSSIINIDESVKASKEKMFVYFKEGDMTSSLTCNITPKFRERFEPTLRGKDLTLFPYEGPYIRAKISSASSVEDVKKFQESFSKLLSIYNKKYDSLLQEYRRYLGESFGKEEVKEVQKKKVLLKDIVPAAFISDYPSRCGHVPTIITEEDAVNKDSIKFPKTVEEGDQYNYVCNHKEYKYVGLFENTLPNKDEFPFLPCCYKTDQRKIEGSPYNQYYLDQEPKKVTGKQQRIITSKKFVNHNVFGELPKEISNLLSLLSGGNENTIFYRKGVHNTKSSFLQCVLEGLYEKTGILSKDPLEFTRKVRREIGNLEIGRYSVCRQELYDKTPLEIKSAIENEDVYLDPKLYYRLLESIYGCKIFIFSRERALEIPKHIKNYLRYRSERPTVIIFEHMGSKSDRATYPRCELIVQTGDVTKYSFTPESEISKGLETVFRQMTESYSLNQENTQPSLPDDINIVSQAIDSYGKTRQIVLASGIVLFTPPIPPLSVEETTIIRRDMDINTTLQGMKEVKDLIQVGEGGNVYEIVGVLGNIPVMAGIVPEKKTKGMPYKEDKLILPREELSLLEIYNKNKKLARYLIQYLFYRFSIFMNESGNKSIDMFIDSATIPINNHTYPERPKREMDINDSGFFQDGKLIIKSRMMQQRLVYVLKLEMERNMEKLTNFRERKFLEDYILDITDMDQSAYQLILFGGEAVDKLISEKKTSHTLQNSLIDSDAPYFYKSESEFLLLQNTTTLENALNISNTWMRDGYNGESEVGEIKDFILRAYESSSNIKNYAVGTPSNLSIFGYKINGNPMYTAIMKI